MHRTKRSRLLVSHFLTVDRNGRGCDSLAYRMIVAKMLSRGARHDSDEQIVVAIEVDIRLSGRCVIVK
jgi:hypothetical protein